MLALGRQTIFLDRVRVANVAVLEAGVLLDVRVAADDHALQFAAANKERHRLAGN